MSVVAISTIASAAHEPKMVTINMAKKVFTVLFILVLYTYECAHCLFEMKGIKPVMSEQFIRSA